MSLENQGVFQLMKEVTWSINRVRFLQELRLYQRSMLIQVWNFFLALFKCLCILTL